MSRENYSSEPEEFIASLKEKLEEKEVEIRELQTQVVLLRQIKELKEKYYIKYFQVKKKIEDKIKELDELVKHAENGSSLKQEDLYKIGETLPLLEELLKGD